MFTTRIYICDIRNTTFFKQAYTFPVGLYVRAQQNNKRLQLIYTMEIIIRTIVVIHFERPQILSDENYKRT
jgi:hypothetical protein